MHFKGDGIKIGIETSGKITKIGYKEDEHFYEISFGSYHSHSEYMIFLWEKIEEKIKDKDIEFVAITEGPGYFTSLRAGFSFAKALWFYKKVPFIGVNTLDALAHPFLKEYENLIVFLKIKRDKVFWKKFLNKKEVEFKMGKIDDIEIDDKFIYVGNDIEISEKVKKCYPLEIPDIKSLIEIGEEKFNEKKFLDMERAEPFYFYFPEYVKAFDKKG
jgi:tRNA threonylcarbamoyl adenosine modification protein YeaZ